MSEEHSGLQADFQLFESHRQEWSLQHEGEYVVVHNGDLLGFFDNYGSGLQAGIAKFGVETEFLIQQVCKEEPVFVIY